ncbi:MAG: DinB family protein [Ignavibacteriaceae bacterium]|nr:DinB family protein [Ignavibacteriaceae bacterium]
MYYKLSHFIEDWKYESESTRKVLSNLTDEALTVKFNNEIRTAGRLAWHIVGAISELGHRMELTFKKIDQDSPFPPSAKEIVNEYKLASDGLIKEITEKWNDETLLIEDKMTGQGDMWSRGKTLGALVTHQIHHRAQLTVVMRLAGLKVPGVYGPAKEEWAGYGMEPQE